MLRAIVKLVCLPVLSLMVLLPVPVKAGERKSEFLMSWGTGPQSHSPQNNSQVALDYNFYGFERSQRSGISFGLGYTYLWTDADTDKKVEAYSFYPQLTLRPVTAALRGGYFFVRALGPSYISHNRLGERQQANHFAFQAQVGAGYRMQLDYNRALLFQVSWKHFSNADLFKVNNSINIPFVFSLGFAF